MTEFNNDELMSRVRAYIEKHGTVTPSNLVAGLAYAMQPAQIQKGLKLLKSSNVAESQNGHITLTTMTTRYQLATKLWNSELMPRIEGGEDPVCEQDTIHPRTRMRVGL